MSGQPRRKGISLRTKLFLQKYVENKRTNMYKAAVEAGFKAKSATVQASKLLMRPEVREELQKMTELALADTGKRAADVLNELSIIGMSDIGNYLKWDDRGRVELLKSEELGDMRRAIKKVRITQKITNLLGEEKSIDDKSEFGDRIETTIDFELHSKTTALKLLGDNLHLFEKDNVTNNFVFVQEKASDEAYRKRLEKINKNKCVGEQ